LLGCALVLFGALPAAAQMPSDYTSNNYAIDLFYGPVTGGGRVVGMGGAYSALATGIDGSLFNPVGYGERAEQELDFFEWDLTGSLGLSGLFVRNDVDNNGQKNDLVADDMFTYSAGGRIQLGNFGMGGTVSGQVYDLIDGDSKSRVSLNTYRAGAAYSFMRNRLVLGLGVRVLEFDVGTPLPDGESDSLIRFEGEGAETGFLYRPPLQRYRIGAVLRLPVESRATSDERVTTVNGVRMVQGFVLPELVHAPWEVQAGFAYQLGERRGNVPWRNTLKLRRLLDEQIQEGTYEPPPTHGGPAYPPLPDEQRAAVRKAVYHDREAQRRYIRNQPRQYVLLSADVIFYGPTDHGQGVAAFLKQQPERSGQKVSLGIRLGTESEVIENRLKVRAGAYVEPSRFARGYYRPHATLGSDVRMFDAWGYSFRATATIDGAPRYFDWGLSLGFWY
jgi:hypothetical protein